MRRSHAAAVIATFVSLSSAQAFDVTECYQIVPDHETAILQTDLVCADNGSNVRLGRGSKLLMNGHSISGGDVGISTTPGTSSRALIIGPGEITGAVGSPTGCAIAASSRVTIENVSLHDNGCGILSIYDFAMKLDGVTITNNAGKGITSQLGNTVSGIGPGKGQIDGRNLTVSGNGSDGIEGFGKLTLRDSTISGNGGAGVRSHGRAFTLNNVTITGNTGAGVASTSAKPGKLKLTTVTGNGPEGDIAAPVAPKLVASTCGTSVDTDSGGTLGICSGD